MKKINFEDMQITPDEMAVIEAYERGELKRSENADEMIAMARIAAENTIKKRMAKDTRITIRLSSADVNAVKKRAAADGLPYQTLIASLVHKFATGRIDV